MPNMLTVKLPRDREAVLFLRNTFVWMAIFRRLPDNRIGPHMIGPAHDILSELYDEEIDALQGAPLNVDADEKIYNAIVYGI